MNKRNKVPLQVSVHLRYLYHDKGLRGKELLKVYPKLSKATIYRHARKSIDDKILPDKRHQNTGRPSVLSKRDRRAIIRQVPILRKECGSFTAKK